MEVEVCCVCTASPTSHTIVHADCNGRRSSDIPKRYTGARDTTFVRSMQKKGFLSVTDTFDAELLPRAKALGNYYVGVSNILCTCCTITITHSMKSTKCKTLSTYIPHM